MEGAGVEYFVNDLFLDVFHCLRYSCYNGCPPGNLRKITQCSCKANQPKKSSKTSDNITCVYIYIYIQNPYQILVQNISAVSGGDIGIFRNPWWRVLPPTNVVPRFLRS